MDNYFTFLIFTVFCTTGTFADNSVVEELVQQWAPRVWMHSKEKFMPWNISNYLQETTPTLMNCSTCYYPSTYLPVGTDSYGYYLITNEDRDSLLNDTTSFLYGSSPAVTSSTLHAFVTSCDPDSSHFVVTYWFFYGFDQGKSILDFGKFASWPVLSYINKYLGTAISSHVGDLERMSLEVKDGVPQSLFLSVHSIGVYYTYDSSTATFKVSHSKTKGISKVENPPKTIELVDGHPVIYSAEGSHGNWGAAGTHTYTKLRLSFLADEVDEGTAWDTWQDLSVHYINDTSSLPDWYEYLGSWGNPGGDCVSIPLVDSKVCAYTDGPPPLASRSPDIYCS